MAIRKGEADRLPGTKRPQSSIRFAIRMIAGGCFKRRNFRMSAAGGYRLPRRSILRGRDTFRALFEKGRGLRSGDILCKYRMVERSGPADALAAFVVSKKHGNAVRRNRAKRLLREAWRLARPEFVERIPDGTELHLALIWVGKKGEEAPPEFDRLRRDLDKGLKRIVPALSGEHASQPSS